MRNSAHGVNMPDGNLPYSLTDYQAATVEALRGNMQQDDFLRLCLQMGLTRFQDEALRLSTEKLYALAHAITQNHEQAIKQFAVLAPGGHNAPAQTARPSPRALLTPE